MTDPLYSVQSLLCRENSKFGIEKKLFERTYNLQPFTIRHYSHPIKTVSGFNFKL